MTKDLAWPLLAAFAAVVFYVAWGYDLGTPAQIGAGAYPLALSAIIFLIAVYSSVFHRPGSEGAAPIAFRPLIAIAASVATFVLIIDHLGMIPSVVATMVIAYLGQAVGRYRSFIAYAAVFAVCAWGLFSYALNMPLPPFRIP